MGRLSCEGRPCPSASIQSPSHKTSSPSTPYAPQLCQKQSHDPLPQSRTPPRIHDQAVSNALTRSVALPAGRDGKRRIRASHLYQLHAYVTHLERLHLGVPRAILLIGHPGAAFTHRYRMGDGEWTVVAVDLRESWSSLCASVVAAATPPTRAFAASLVPLGGSKPTT